MGSRNDMPEICGMEEEIEALNKKKKKPYPTNLDFKKVKSAFGIALHMHQPSIPADTDDIGTAGLISNLEHMMRNQGIGDNHNASVFLWCYGRMSDITRELVAYGKNPRVMLDYSGNLLWGLKQMGHQDVLDNLALVTNNKEYAPYVEWVGTMWSHAVATSTPIPDMKLQMMAWRNHFASIFGMKALEKVRGFSPPEMHLPIHPDVCYEYVKTLKECGYEWLMVQEHTVENLDGRGIRNPHYPHKLVAKNSEGKVEEITILVKTQGSDTKLVAQMQPYYEAKGLDRRDYCGKKIPAFVLQIGDGENGGVMMNEFPPGYKIAYGEIEKSGTVGMNGSEYLDFLKEEGVDEEDYTPVQPIGQHRIWEHVGKFYPGACDDAIKKVKERDQSFNLDKGSWTSDKNWVHGYENVLDPMNKLSVAFHRRFGDKKTAVTSHKYKEALLYLLLSQTSCFRYWGQGIWTEYAKEIIRRGMEAVK